jgi:alpha-tubulin suppressor-like RCC1 family protein
MKRQWLLLVLGVLLAVFVLTTISEAATGSIAASSYHTMLIKAEGSLWAWGDNSSGQLGDGTTTNKSSPTQLGTGKDWTAVKGGYAPQTVAIKSNGTLWAWGNNSGGQLGDGTTTNKSFPTQVGTATNWSIISAGDSHTVAIKTDGTLWAWGSNTYGQLGNGTTTAQYSPIQIGTATNWSAVAAGQFHTLAIKTDGTLWAWGWNLSGQLGDGTTDDKSSPIKIGTAVNWSAVAAGYAHTIALRSDGTLWAWGLNSNGQLGDGSTTAIYSPQKVGTGSSWAVIAAGDSHTIAIMSDGTLWTCGKNDNGQIGDGTTTQKNDLTKIGSATSWTAIAGGARHTVAARSDGTVLAWGDNSKGQLGDGTTTNRLSPAELNISTEDTKTGCFIATAAFGSYFHPYVSTLRSFRDTFLIPNSIGRSFVAWYYRVSPSVADKIRPNKFMKAGVMILLLPLVGLSYLFLKIGMIKGILILLVIGAMVFIKIRKLYLSVQARPSANRHLMKRLPC